MEFTTEEFMTLATFAMCNDHPDQSECIDSNLHHSILNRIAEHLGFADWIDAYHQLPSPSVSWFTKPN